MKPKVTAIIQARMTSTRLPGKVLMEVMGRPLLSYQIERLRFCGRIRDIIIATTTNKEDDLIAELSHKEGLKLYRGSEDDVLDRYYQAAKEYEAGYIMRLTADCPLIDPAHLDKMIKTFFLENADYIFPSPTHAEGTDAEVFTFDTLGKAYNHSKLRSEREHVTQYFHNNTEMFRIVRLENKSDDSKYRFTVDEKEDFQVVKSIIEELYNTKNSPFGVEEIKDFLDNHPEIFRLNSRIIRNEGLIKSLEEDFEVR
jgi:spore coat polysaccharide biosynthesis protein SpsF (cytidylyltransferase family)